MPSFVAYFSWLLGSVLLVLALAFAQSRARRSEVGRKALAAIGQVFWIAVALFHGCWLGALLPFVLTGLLGRALPRNVAFGLSSVSVGLLAAAMLVLMIWASTRERARPPHLICCVLGVICLQTLCLFAGGVSTCWMFVYR